MGWYLRQLADAVSEISKEELVKRFQKGEPKMKNVKSLLVATLALLSVNSMAVLIQPLAPVSEDAPMRVSLAAKSGLIDNTNPALPGSGFGLSNLGGGLGFAHNVGYDFQWGLAASYDWVGLRGGRIFKENEPAGSRIAAELSLGFLPEVAEKFHLGGLFGFGWAGSFGENVTKELEGSGFSRVGEFNLRVNIELSYWFSDMFNMSLAPGYTLSHIRFAKSDASDMQKEAIKKVSSFSGIELPLEFFIAASENVAVYLNANTKFVDITKAKDSWREDLTLGLAFAM